MVVRCCQAKHRNILGRGAQVMLVGILLMVVPVAAGGTGGQEVSTTSALSKECMFRKKLYVLIVCIYMYR